MGGAIIRGLKNFSADVALTITAHSQVTLDKFISQYPDITCTLDNTQAVKDADVVILAVKPWLVNDVIAEITDALGTTPLISVAAKAPHNRIDVYAMPNIAAEYGESMTFIEQCDNANALSIAEKIFGYLGKVKVVPTRLMGAGMMMAGCGIAYVMRYLRAMMEGGIEMGFYPNDAKDIAMQTMQGAVTLLQETGMHPEAAIDKVTTPGGITIKGLNELDHTGFNSAVIKSLKAGL